MNMQLNNHETEIRIVRIIQENKSLLNEHSFESFPYGDKIDSAAKAHEIISDQHTYLYFALTYEVLTGYALAYRFPGLFCKGQLAYLYDIEILPQYRQRGFGTSLIERIKSDLLIEGVEELWLGTDLSNEPAQALYSSTGAIRSEETFYDYTYSL